MLDDIPADLAEARGKLEAVRNALQSALDALDTQDDQEVDLAPIQELADRLDRMAAEVARIEGVVRHVVTEVG